MIGAALTLQLAVLGGMSSPVVEDACEPLAAQRLQLVAEARSRCPAVSEIEALPGPLDRWKDPVYLRFRVLSYDGLPCLVQAVSDNESVPAPAGWSDRFSPTVGDIALRIVEDIVGTDAYEEAVTGAHTVGVPLGDRSQREAVQRALSTWYRRELKKDHSTRTAGETCHSCRSLVPLVRSIPFESQVPPAGSVEPTLDDAYAAFERTGSSAIPCLLDKLQDRRAVNDPRSAARSRTTVGDVALMLIGRLCPEGVDAFLAATLPAAVLAKYREVGYDAVIVYSADSKNRQLLQKAIRAWNSRRPKTKP